MNSSIVFEIIILVALLFDVYSIITKKGSFANKLQRKYTEESVEKYRKISVPFILIGAIFEVVLILNDLNVINISFLQSGEGWQSIVCRFLGIAPYLIISIIAYACILKKKTNTSSSAKSDDEDF